MERHVVNEQKNVKLHLLSMHCWERSNRLRKHLNSTLWKNRESRWMTYGGWGLVHQLTEVDSGWQCDTKRRDTSPALGVPPKNDTISMTWQRMTCSIWPEWHMPSWTMYPQENIFFSDKLMDCQMCQPAVLHLHEHVLTNCRYLFSFPSLWSWATNHCNDKQLSTFFKENCTAFSLEDLSLDVPWLNI